MIDAIVGVDELFADLLAVLSLNDPKAVGAAIKRERRYRDFSDKTNDIERWIPSNKKHHSYAPTRYFIYSKMMPKMAPQKTAKLVYSSIVEHIQELGKNIASLNVSERNRHLIEIMGRKIGP